MHCLDHCDILSGLFKKYKEECGRITSCVTVRKLYRCLTLCLSVDGCQGAFYNGAKAICHLVGDRQDTSVAIQCPGEGMKYYHHIV